MAKKAVSDERVAIARGIIRRAEVDLGTLSDGQRRDLLMDNTEWDSDAVRAIVEEVKKATDYDDNNLACLELEHAGYVRDPLAHTQFMNFKTGEYAKVGMRPLKPGDEREDARYYVAYFGRA